MQHTIVTVSFMLLVATVSAVSISAQSLSQLEVDAEKLFDKDFVENLQHDAKKQFDAAMNTTLGHKAEKFGEEVMDKIKFKKPSNETNS